MVGWQAWFGLGGTCFIAKAAKILSFSGGFRVAGEQIKASRSTTTSSNFERQCAVFKAK
jgi:hypothetical protein